MKKKMKLIRKILKLIRKIFCFLGIHYWIEYQTQYTDAHDIGFNLAIERHRFKCERCGKKKETSKSYIGWNKHNLNPFGLHDVDKWFDV